MEVEPTDGLAYCMWADDLVSKNALNDFQWEPHLWSWVLKIFSIVNQKNVTSQCDQLGYLDLGANVGDAISPIRLVAPDFPIYAVEGTPATAAISLANLRTSVEHHLKQGVPVAATKLLPFSLILQRQVKVTKAKGGVCFDDQGKGSNVGGQGVESVGDSECPAAFIAGGTTFEQALRGLAAPCAGLDWPRIYVAKIDIQSYEFKALTSAYQWLSRRPPCFIIMKSWTLHKL